MPENIEGQLREQSAKLDAIYASVEKTRKYFLMIMWISIAMVVLPMIGLLFAIPTFISTYSDVSQLYSI
jgi:hypothetical protein